ncbi:MAG TPA: CPBP family intramembrane metalloprotease [Candidatus Ornithospirochaeta avicola]|uniref:CPBP family intramembrane metalloprotease n=1 Tax=Candidatus Ornithospirochaeta avicola TaxID=2840896 RepID=A0A9D1PTA0_9SPIO|nr:CPBP family intramembrane metalloprotease [Candidatus Ornithospirochaeta avicola]
MGIRRNIVYIILLSALSFIIMPFFSAFIFFQSNIDEGIKSLILSLFPFFLSFAVFSAIYWKAEKESIFDLLKNGKKMDRRIILLVAVILILFFSLQFAAEKESIRANDAEKRLIALSFILSAFLLFFQIAVEEMIFRIFFYRIIRNKAFYAIFTSLLFALLHSANPEVGYSPFLIMLYYFLSALLLSIMVLITDSFEASLVYHYLNNFFIAVILKSSSGKTSLNSYALFINDSNFSPAKAVLSIAVLLLILTGALLALKRRDYGKKEKEE